MLESLNTSIFEYERLKPEEMQKRGILGRLVGVMADTVNPTRNGRSYSSKLWENVFANPIMKERIENNCCFGELGHPIDREETDMEKIAICMDGVPKMDKDGKLQAVFNILDTPNGRILKTLCDYGCNIGISSRGSGDLVTDFDGNESVDPDTYNCEGWDAVLIPAVKEARLKYVTESLDKKRYNKSLRTKLQEALNKETADNRKVMTESLSTLGILLEANEYEPEAGPKPDEKFINDMDKLKQEEEPEVEEKEETIEVEEEPEEESDNFTYKDVEVIKNPENGKFVCEIDGDSYSFNNEKNAKIWIDMNQKNKKSSLKEEQVGRDETKDDKNVDDVLKPDTYTNKDISSKESSEEDKEKEEDKNKVTVTISEANGNDPHINVKLEKPYIASIFDNGEVSISSIRPYDDGEYYYANYNGNSEGIFFICQDGRIKEKLKVNINDKSFKDVVERLKQLDSTVKSRMMYDSYKSSNANNRLIESIDWTDLNGTEQFAADSALSYLKDHMFGANEIDRFDEIELAVSDAVSMYNEANAFDEYSDEDFYEEEAEYSKVLRYVLQQLGLDEESNLDEGLMSENNLLKEDTVSVSPKQGIKLVAKPFNYTMYYNGKQIDINSAVVVIPNAIKYGDGTITDGSVICEDPRTGKPINFKTIEEAQDWIDTYGDDCLYRLEGNTLIATPKQLYDINNSVPFVVDNIETEVDTLQEMLKQNQALEKQIIDLQEKLSVSNAMEKELREKLSQSNDKISVLSKVTKENKVLTEQLSAVKGSAAESEKQFNESKYKIKSLREKLNTLKEENATQESELISLREDYEILNRDLTQTKEQFSKKFEKQNQLLEKYQKITKNAIDRYINMQAVNLGVKPVEIKNRLSESFTFNDIDSVCEDLREYKLNVSRLPFSTGKQLNENIEIKMNNFDNNNLFPRNEVDELTDYDMKLMEAYL